LALIPPRELQRALVRGASIGYLSREQQRDAEELPKQSGDRMNERNPYAAPKAAVRDVSDEASADIEALDVSNNWKTRFRLIERAGGAKLPHIKELQFGDRAKVMFNVLAFLFGPLYYVAKGLWRKAITFFVLGVIILAALSIALTTAGLDDMSRALGYGLAAFFATRANIDYYKRMVLNDNSWW
jgi:hypothetical protein